MPLREVRFSGEVQAIGREGVHSSKRSQHQSGHPVIGRRRTGATLERAMNPIVPDDLAELPRWAVWRMESSAKIPYRVGGGRASTTNPIHWGELDCARAALASRSFSGLAFAFFQEDGLVGIDLDDSLDAVENPKAGFRGMVQRFAYTYTEVSPSGHGLKIWVRGALPANMPKVKVESGGVEMYDHSRYFTFTGRRYRGAPLQVEDHAEDVLSLYKHLTVDKSKAWSVQPLQGGRIPYGQQRLVYPATSRRSNSLWPAAQHAREHLRNPAGAPRLRRCDTCLPPGC